MTDLLQEYSAVREHIGQFDRSDAGWLALTGSDRYSWLQGMVSNDVRLLEKGESVRLPACILDATGHLISDLVLIDVSIKSAVSPTGHTRLASALQLPEEAFLLVELPLVNLGKVQAIFDRYLILEDVEVTNVSGLLAGLSLQGPGATRAWARKSDTHDRPDTVLNSILDSTFACAADHTGSGGFDLIGPTEAINAASATLAAAGILPISNPTRDLLRIEAGIPVYGQELSESVIALEAGIGPTHISLTKGCYVGQEIIARIDSRGHTNRALTGFVLSGPQIPAPGDKLFAQDAATESGWKETGRLTSIAADSPAAGGRPIALGYARHEHRAPGTVLCVGAPGSKILAEAVALPFFPPAPAGVPQARSHSSSESGEPGR